MYDFYNHLTSPSMKNTLKIECTQKVLSQHCVGLAEKAAC